nr:sart-1 family protein dot2 [Quercus suber]
MQKDEEPRAFDEEVKDEAGRWTEVIDVSKIEHTTEEDKEEIVLDETIHEVAVGKRNMDKKKRKLMGIVDDDESKEPCRSALVDFKKEIRIERTDEFGQGHHRHLGSHEMIVLGS